MDKLAEAFVEINLRYEPLRRTLSQMKDELTNKMKEVEKAAVIVPQATSASSPQSETQLRKQVATALEEVKTASDRYAESVVFLDTALKKGMITQEQYIALHERATIALHASQSGAGRLGFAMQQASYGLQDFITVLSIGEMNAQTFRMALMSASNNIAQMAMIISPTKGAMIGLWATIGAVALPILYEIADGMQLFGEETLTATDKVDRLNESLKETEKLLSRQAGKYSDERRVAELETTGDSKAIEQEINSQKDKARELRSEEGHLRDELARANELIQKRRDFANMEFIGAGKPMTQDEIDLRAKEDADMAARAETIRQKQREASTAERRGESLVPRFQQKYAQEQLQAEKDMRQHFAAEEEKAKQERVEQDMKRQERYMQQARRDSEFLQKEGISILGLSSPEAAKKAESQSRYEQRMNALLGMGVSDATLEQGHELFAAARDAEGKGKEKDGGKAAMQSIDGLSKSIQLGLFPDKQEKAVLDTAKWTEKSQEFLQTIVREGVKFKEPPTAVMGP